MTEKIDAEALQTERCNRLMRDLPDREPANIADYMPLDVFALPEKTESPGASPLEQLKALSVTGRVEKMRADLGNEVYVFEGLAIGGQITLFYAKPSTGKTLLFIHLLLQSIQRGIIEPESIFYINSDDDHRGLITKGEIAKDYGFEMIGPSEAGLTSQEIIDLLIDMAATPAGKGKIVILDTVKKFVNLMSKHEQSAFYSTLRILSANEVTVILAGHSNKYTDAEGELIYEGTSDTLNDIDCVYAINRISDQDSDEMVIELRNKKPRGDVLKKASFKYDNRPETTWADRLRSVTRLDDRAASAASFESAKQDKIKKHESSKLFVCALLEAGSLNLSEITRQHTEHRQNPNSDLHPLASEITTRNLQSALDKLTNITWSMSRGFRHNEKIYTLIDADGARYRACKNGR